MIVVADASPLVALALCESLNILDQLFGEIKVAHAVYSEVSVSGKPKADILEEYLQAKVVDVDLSKLVIGGTFLDTGEISSMMLYKHLKADYLLIDEQVGRRIAKLNQIKVIGSLGVLIEAKNKGLISSIRPHVETFKSSKLYFSQYLLDHALKMTNED